MIFKTTDHNYGHMGTLTNRLKRMSFAYLTNQTLCHSIPGGLHTFPFLGAMEIIGLMNVKDEDVCWEIGSGACSFAAALSVQSATTVVCTDIGEVHANVKTVFQAMQVNGGADALEKKYKERSALCDDALHALWESFFPFTSVYATADDIDEICNSTLNE